MVQLFSKAQVDALRLPKPTKDMASTLRVYGDPGRNKKADPNWFKARMQKITLPYPMRLAWDTSQVVNSILIHEYAIDLVHILKDVQLNARVMVKEEWLKTHETLPTTPEIDEMTIKFLQKHGLDLFGGTYNHRLKRGGRSLSAHAFGAAIDIDPVRNGMGNTKYSMPEWVIQIFEGYGWTSGARWKGKYCDSMHYSRVGF